MAGYNKKAVQTTHAGDGHQSHAEHLREKHLMLDPLPRGQMNSMVMEAMTEPPTWKFWVIFVDIGCDRRLFSVL